MHAPADHSPRSPRFSRRGLLAAGGFGMATLWLGPAWNLDSGGIAEAAVLRPELRRSAWMSLTGTVVDVLDGAVVRLRLIEVADLPIAETLPDLRDHDGAFALRFSGTPGLGQGLRQLRHAELGEFGLFLVPVGAPGASQRYEAIIDRTVRIAGVNEEGIPQPDRIEVAEVRAAVPAPADGSPTTPGTSASAARSRPTVGPRPRLRRVALRRGSSARVLLADLALTDAAAVVSVRALLFSRGRLVARTAVDVRRPQRLRLRLPGRRGLARGRYQLVLTLVDHDGRVTRIVRNLRFR